MTSSTFRVQADVNIPVIVRKIDPNLLKDCRGKFVVAEFLPFNEIDEMTIEAIPGYWVQNTSTPYICHITGDDGELVKSIKSYIFAYVPQNETIHGIRKAKMSNCLPDSERWLKWPINCVLNKVFDNYQDARKEEVGAEAYPHSDLEGYFVGDTTYGTRIKINKKKWPGDTTSEIDSASEEEQSDENLPKKNCPKNKRSTKKIPSNTVTAKISSPPLYAAEVGFNSAVSCDVQSTVTDLTDPLHIPFPDLPEASNTSSSQASVDITSASVPDNDDLTSLPYSPKASNISFHEATVIAVDTDIATAFDVSSLNLSGLPTGFHAEIDLENVDLLRQLEQEGKTKDDFYKACFLRILNQNVENKTKLDKLQALLEETVAKLSHVHISQDSDEHMFQMKNLIALPVTTMDDLKLLNNTLTENKNYFTYLKNFMSECCTVPILANYDSKIVKQELQKMVGLFFPRIMTNELAVTLNMYGRNHHPNLPKKEALKTYSEILVVTFEAMKPKAKLANLELNRAQSDSAIGEWLRLAKNRLSENKESKRLYMAQRRAMKKNKSDVD